LIKQETTCIVITYEGVQDPCCKNVQGCGCKEARIHYQAGCCQEDCLVQLQELDLMYNIGGTLLSFPYLMPLIDLVNSLMKFVQSNHLFISDYIMAVKICQSELYMMYCDNDMA